MSRPLVTIILPTHNRADVLPFAISSCLAQSVADFELLVLGDGCTDNTASVVAGTGDERVRWFDRPKAPHFGYAHRNFALQEARGDFIAWQAHDDLWLPDHLERMLGLLRHEGVAWVHSRPTWVTASGEICPSAFFLDDPDTRKLFLAMEDSMVYSNCVMHRRNCVERVGLWNTTMPSCGDWDYWARIIRDAEQVSVLREITTLHFRAIWRIGSDFAGARLEPILDWHANGGPDRDALRISIPAGVTEQEATWREIENDPSGWVSRLRNTAARADFSRLAEQEKKSRLDALERDRRRATEEMEKANEAIQRQLAIQQQQQDVSIVEHPGLRERYWRMRWRLLSVLQRLKNGT